MGMREKLIELLSENFAEFCNVDIITGNCKIRAITFDADKFADHLIANGVTIQKWIPVTERLPKEDNFLAVTKGKLVGEAFIMQGEIYWQEDAVEWDDAEPITERVTHWMPLPEPPSGERRTDD